jgi:hypothetical protein
MLVRITKSRDGVEYVYTVQAYRDEHGKGRQRIIQRHGRLADRDPRRVHASTAR